MMNKLLVSMLMLFLLTACTDDLGAMDLDQANNGQTLTVTSGQMIDVKLDSNITTGYSWSLVGEPNPQILKFVSSKYNDPVGGAVGAGGSETWVFQATGRGTTSFKLAYFRPFEKNTPPAKEFSVTFTVQ